VLIRDWGGPRSLLGREQAQPGFVLGGEGALHVGDEAGSVGGVRVGWEAPDQQVEPVGGGREAGGDPVALGRTQVGGQGGTDGSGGADPQGVPFRSGIRQLSQAPFSQVRGPFS
jgi:hypothetical protein